MDNSEIPVIDNKNTEVSNETSATKMQSPAAESSNIETGDINQLDQITESGIQSGLMEHENINEENEHEDSMSGFTTFIRILQLAIRKIPIYPRPRSLQKSRMVSLHCH